MGNLRSQTSQSITTEPIFIPHASRSFSQKGFQFQSKSISRPQTQAYTRTNLPTLNAVNLSLPFTTLLGTRSEIIGSSWSVEHDEDIEYDATSTASDRTEPFQFQKKEKPNKGRRKSFVDTVKPVAALISALARRLLKEREVIEGFSRHIGEQVCLDLQKLNRLVQCLREKLGSTVDIPKLERVEAEQATTLIKLGMMTLFQNASALAVEAEHGLLCDTEACVMAVECRELVQSLTARLDCDARITPASALRTLAAAKRRFGLAVLERIGLGGRRVVADDELEPHLRSVFAEFDADDSGSIDLAELGAAMALLEVPATDASLRRFLADADADGNGAVSLAEFRALTASVLRENGVAVVTSFFRASPESFSSRVSPEPAAEPVQPGDGPQRDVPSRHSYELRVPVVKDLAPLVPAFHGQPLPARTGMEAAPLRRGAPSRARTRTRPPARGGGRAQAVSLTSPAREPGGRARCLRISQAENPPS